MKDATWYGRMADAARTFKQLEELKAMSGAASEKTEQIDYVSTHGANSFPKPPPEYLEIELPTYAHVGKAAPDSPAKGLHEYFSGLCSGQTYLRLIQDEERARELVRGVRESCAIVVVGISGFNTVASAMRPDRAMMLLGVFLDEMIGLIRDESGACIIKVMGERVISCFGLPFPQEYCRNAVRMASAMQTRMLDVNARLGRIGFPSVGLAISVASGDTVAGFSSTDKTIAGLSVTGEAVDRAMELQKTAPGGEILIDQATLEGIGVEFQISEPFVGYSTRPPLNSYSVIWRKDVTEYE